MPRQKFLNSRQLKFVRLIVSGESIAQSHRRAGYSCPTIEGHGANGIRLLKQDRIKSEIAKLREKAFERDALTFAEKRSFLARAVRTSVAEIGSSSDLAQEVVEEVDAHGNVRRRIKAVDKIRCLEADNRMAGHDWKDREPQQSNPFLLIVAMGKDSEQFKIANANGINTAEPITIEAKSEVIQPAV
jgi:phage terminase small subunit